MDQQIINYFYQFCHFTSNGKTTLTNETLLVISVCFIILIIMLLIVYIQKNKVTKVLVTTKKAVEETKVYTESILSEKERIKKESDKLGNHLAELNKQYNQSNSDLQVAKKLLANLKYRYNEASTKLSHEREMTHLLQLKVHEAEKNLYECNQKFQTELDNVKSQFNKIKIAYEELNIENTQIKEIHMELFQEYEDLKIKEENANYEIAYLQDIITQNRSFIVKLQESASAFQKESYRMKESLKGKDKELQELKEKQVVRNSIDNKRKMNPFERLANW